MDAIINKTKKTIVPYQHDMLSKSNYFIGAKYKASVLENQITYLAMLKIQEGEYKERPEGIYVTLSAAEIKRETGATSGSFYDNLKRVASEMTGNNMGIVDDENQRFTFITLINLAEYENSQFTIKFAPELREHLVDVRKNFTFTNLNKNITMHLKKKPYSIPLYELLKSQCYYPSNYHGERNNVFSVSVGLSELKLDIGLVNIKNSPDVKQALRLGTGTTEDYDRAVAKSKDKMYNTWAEFDRSCLKKTVEEINAVSDIYVEYKKQTRGRGGKVYGVEFIVYLNGAEKDNIDSTTVTIDNEQNVHVNMTDEEKFQFNYEVLNLVSPYGVGFGEVVAIGKAAEMNIENVKKAVAMLDKAKNVNNPTAWLIACIKDRYWEDDTECIQGEIVGSAPVIGFNAHEQHDYTSDEMDDLEKKLLNEWA
jgi:plasmid replication initiation protein